MVYLLHNLGLDQTKTLLFTASYSERFVPKPYATLRICAKCIPQIQNKNTDSTTLERVRVEMEWKTS